MQKRNSKFKIIFLILTGLAVGASLSVFATSLGTNLTITGNVAVSGTATSTLTGPIAGTSGNLIVSRGGTGNLLLNPYGGNVGIGTTSPWGFLSVNPNNIGSGPEFAVGSSTATNFAVYNNGDVLIGTSTDSVYDFAGVAGGVLNISTGVSDGRPLLIFSGDNTYTGQIAAYGSGIRTGGIDFFGLSGDLNDGSVDIYTSATTHPGAAIRMRAGLVGINTLSTPAYTLDVVDKRHDGTGLFRVSHSNASNVPVDPASMVVAYNGNVGIGTTTPTSLLAIATSTATSTLQIGTSQSATKGSCIQLYSPSGAEFRAYATTTGPLILESGTCQ